MTRYRVFPTSALLVSLAITTPVSAQDPIYDEHWDCLGLAATDFMQGPEGDPDYWRREDLISKSELVFRCAKEGVGEAEYYAGYMYYHGQGGVQQDYVEAARWFHLAVEHFYNGYEELGEMYAEGLGVTENPARALKWYEFAVLECRWRSCPNQISENRDRLRGRMTIQQVAEAEVLIAAWKEAHPEVNW